MGMLGGVVVEVDCEEGDDVGDGLDFVLGVSKDVGLIEVELAQEEIKIVLSGFEGFEFVLLIFEDGDGVIVLDALFLVELEVAVVEGADSVHGHPFVESGFGNSELLFEALFLLDVKVEFGAVGLLVGFELDLGFLEMGQKFEFGFPKGFGHLCELGLGHDCEDGHDHVGVLFPDGVVSFEFDKVEHFAVVVIFIVFVELVFGVGGFDFLFDVVFYLAFEFGILGFEHF